MARVCREEPDPEDYVKTPCGRLGSKVCVSQVEGDFLGEFDTDKDANRAICDKMNREQFFPNVWFLSDHGNLHPTRIRCRRHKR